MVLHRIWWWLLLLLWVSFYVSNAKPHGLLQCGYMKLVWALCMLSSMVLIDWVFVKPVLIPPPTVANKLGCGLIQLWVKTSAVIVNTAFRAQEEVDFLQFFYNGDSKSFPDLYMFNLGTVQLLLLLSSSKPCFPITPFYMKWFLLTLALKSPSRRFFSLLGMRCKASSSTW